MVQAYTSTYVINKPWPAFCNSPECSAAYKGLFTYSEPVKNGENMKHKETNESVGRMNTVHEAGFFMPHKEAAKASPWPRHTTGVNTLMPANKGKLCKLCRASDTLSKVKLRFYSTHTMSAGPMVANALFPLSLKSRFDFFFFFSSLGSSTDFSWHIREWLHFGGDALQD